MEGHPSDGYQGEIENLAYRLWQERGCPLGSPEDDWFKAERELDRGLIGSPERLPFSSMGMGHVTS